ncbi:MAG: FIST C-terminal domain-containing protein [bacterium]|jgi:small ligand-binding sensory domain FIST|nr:FIST C-terminal domain-containing protein [bacterium]
MRISASAAYGTKADEIIHQIVATVKTALEGEQPHLALLYLTPSIAHWAEFALEHVYRELNPRSVAGCTAEGVIGPEGEFEREPAACLWVAHWPEASLRTFYINQQAIESCSHPEDWKALFQCPNPSAASMLVLGDPYSLHVHNFLQGINQHLPGLLVTGGMASGIDESGVNTMILDRDIYQDGAICVLMENTRPLDFVVSQGCRPIGTPWLVTDGEHNIISRLGGKKPLDLIRDLYQTLTGNERQLVQNGLFLGRVIDEYKKDFTRGDFLIRNLIGADKEKGSIAVADILPLGTTVQFHIRDAQTAEEDLQSLLAPHSTHPPQGAWVFNCNGRGTRLFKKENHDLQLIQDALQKPPIGGFFCAGEFGPIGGKNFIHGHTVSLALFR